VPVFLGGRKAKELYFGGQKTKEAWLNGKKVYSVTLTGVDCSAIRLYYRRAASPSVNAFFLESPPVSSLQAPTVTATIKVHNGDRFFMQANGDKPEATIHYSATYLKPI